MILWGYCTTYKMLTRQNMFRLAYGQEVFMPLEYIVPSIRMATITKMTDIGVVEERLSQLVQLEEDLFL